MAAVGPPPRRCRTAPAPVVECHRPVDGAGLTRSLTIATVHGTLSRCDRSEPLPEGQPDLADDGPVPSVELLDPHVSAFHRSPQFGDLRLEPRLLIAEPYELRDLRFLVTRDVADLLAEERRRLHGFFPSG